MPLLLRGSWAIAVVMVLTCSARADLCPVPADQPASPIQVFTDSRAVTPSTGPIGLQASGAAMRRDLSSLLSDWQGDVFGEAVARRGKVTVHQIPISPDSARLFLSAMLSVGAWHLVRSARHLHWGALPEWYHAGGPLQIGQSVPLDLDFYALPAGVERVDAEAGELPILSRARQNERPRCDVQPFIMIRAPRAPPIFGHFH